MSIDELDSEDAGRMSNCAAFIAFAVIWLDAVVGRWWRRLRLSFHRQSGYPKQPWRVEFWSGDERYRASVHFHWNWRGRAHWLCVFLPEF